jgi:hypothetical protein
VKCDGVLGKPLEPGQVLSRVNELLGLATAEPIGATVPRNIERLIPPRPLEFPRRREAEGSSAMAAMPSTAMPATPVPAPTMAPDTADPPASGLSIDRELDEYFEQLDAAFESLGADPTASGRLADPLRGLDDDDGRPVPTVDRLIGADGSPTGNVPVPRSDAVRGTFDLQTAGDPPSGLSTRPAPPATTQAPAPRLFVPPSGPSPLSDSSAGATTAGEHHKPGTIADAFAALLAFEEGDRSIPPVRLVPPPVAPVIGEEAIEEITRRVLARLAPGAVKDLVAEVVSEVAERLVRQEIERIRKNS